MFLSVWHDEGQNSVACRSGLITYLCCLYGNDVDKYLQEYVNYKYRSGMSVAQNSRI